MNNNTYRLIPSKIRKVSEDFEQFLSGLINAQQFEVSHHDNVIEFSLKDTGLTAQLMFPINEGEYENDYELPSQEIKFICQAIDSTTVNSIKLFAEKLDYRVFSEELNSFLPRSLFILNTKSELAKRSDELFQSQGLKPMFYDSFFKTTYARSYTDGSIHIVNEALYRYFLDFGSSEEKIEEFSYKVAESLDEFVTFSDNFLIPTSFYQYYKKPLKILNDSNFDAENMSRKVFVKPLIWELDSEKKEFYLLSKEGSSLVFMDKIRPGESFEATIKRILREELKIADDFRRARVLPDLEFDRDRDDKLTPRLVVAVFVNKINKTEDIKKRSRRSWNAIS